MKITSCANRPVLDPCALERFHYQVDPYIGCAHYCYYCFVLNRAETDWLKEIGIHKNLIARLSDAIDQEPPQTIFMGCHTDPYQPCEAEYQQTRKVLELLVHKGFTASILTKSDLVLRDTDILNQMKDAGVSMSVAFHDDQTRALFEANTMDTEKRIEALRRLKEAGIRTGALVCPVIPYITDAIRLIERLQPHADEIWIYGLGFDDRLGQNWFNFQLILNNQFPDKKERIEQAIFSKDDRYWTGLRQSLAAWKKQRQLKLNIHL